MEKWLVAPGNAIICKVVAPHSTLVMGSGIDLNGLLEWPYRKLCAVSH
jgi:hypothetical protein